MELRVLRFFLETAREGLGYVLTFDKLVDTGAESPLCFRPLTPRLETKLYFIWEKHQIFTPLPSCCRRR